MRGVPASYAMGQQLLLLPARSMQITCRSSAAVARAQSVVHAGPQAQQPIQGSGQLQPITSVYIHLPFCKRKCFYCDFPVEALGGDLESTRSQERMQRYVAMVCAEIAATRQQGSLPLQTVYFGGGTPSLVPPALMAHILQALDQRFGIASKAEVSLEADPGTFDVARLKAYQALGFNRISMGVQSFQQELLETCGRSHSLQDVHDAIEALHASGIPSWNLDLISGLPHLTASMWQASLDAAVAAQPSHISVYDLQVEPGTPFARRYSAGQSPLPPDDDAAAMYACAVNTLTRAGFEHYEVSNYARPGHRSRHNQVYWSGGQYYAFGLGAASYQAGIRFTRPDKMPAYTAWLDSMTAAGGDVIPGADVPPQTMEDILLDTIMLRLRTADGLDLAELASEHGVEAAQTVLTALQPHIQRGLALVQPTITAAPAARMLSAAARNQASLVAALAGAITLTPALPVVRLSDPNGFLLSNDIISDIFAALPKSD